MTNDHFMLAFIFEIEGKEVWRKMYFSEKKATTPIEEESQKLRRLLNSLNEKILVALKNSAKPDAATERSNKTSKNLRATKTKTKRDDSDNNDENNGLRNTVCKSLYSF